jgi:hypothetical protein
MELLASANQNRSAVDVEDLSGDESGERRT